MIARDAKENHRSQGHRGRNIVVIGHCDWASAKDGVVWRPGEPQEATPPGCTPGSRESESARCPQLPSLKVLLDTSPVANDHYVYMRHSLTI
jgi:hypothetical protein